MRAPIRTTVRFYDGGVLVKTHPRVSRPAAASTDPHDFPRRSGVYALRDVDSLQRQADGARRGVGRFAAALLDGPLPWTRMRRVYALLLGLVRRYGAARVD